MKFAKIVKRLLEFNSSKYTIDFLKILDQWELGTAVDKNIFVKYVNNTNLDKKFRTVDKPIYRLIYLKNLEQFKQTVSSWTTSLKYSKEWKDAVAGSTRGKQAYVLGITNPKDSNCILNIYDLYKDPVFRNTVKYYKHNDIDFEYPMGSNDSEHEVIYKANFNEIDIIFQYDWDIKKWKKIK